MGSLSDNFGGRRACVITVFTLLLVPLLWVLAQYSDELSAGSLLVLLGVAGVLVGGPNSIITSVVSVDLAQHPSIRGNGQACESVLQYISNMANASLHTFAL